MDKFLILKRLKRTRDELSATISALEVEIFGCDSYSSVPCLTSKEVALARDDTVSRLRVIFFVSRRMKIDFSRAKEMVDSSL